MTHQQDILAPGIHFILMMFVVLGASAHPAADAPPKSVQAVRANIAPQIDGRLDDAVWASAPRASGFTQSDPDEGEPASERTTFQVAYDDDTLYVGVMCYDSEPDGIVSALTRRGAWAERDWVSVNIDPRHDHRTGVFFVVGPSGWQLDGVTFRDGDEDDTWEGVWAAEAAVNGEGWCAELAIPYHVLRLREQEEYTWGIYVHRAISRKQERAQWIHFPKGTNGWNSRFGHLTGITGISPTRPVEAAPFTVGSSTFTAGDGGTEGVASAGVDLRYGLASGMSLNATINPDFGQVEADPAVLNLGVFETFFEERRPFFIEGSSVFRGPNPDIVGIDGPARLFHSRRIGRAPGRFGVPDGFEELARPRATTILGAAKLSGKTAGGTSYGILDALTADEYADVRRSGDEGQGRETYRVEPRTNYLVGRVQQDVLGGSTVGGTVTAMNGDGFAPALVASADGELKWADSAYRAFTRASASRTGAIGDRDSGYEAAAYFSKFSGWFGGQVYADARSPGFNANDLGFMSRAGRTQVGGHAYAQIQNPWALARRSGFNLNAWRQANYDGLALEQGVNVNSWHSLKNYWWLNFGINREFAVYDDLATRGGPAMRRPAAVRWWTNVNSDDRKTVAAGVSMMGVRSDGGDSSYQRRSVRVEVKPATNVQVHVSSSVSSEISFAQWIENLDADGDGEDDRFVFGELDSDVFDVSLRLNVALTRTLTLQGYVQPFVAVGDYTAFKELTRPKSYDFTPVAETILSASPDFTRRSLRSNVVLRWEYRPGSALFAVWSQNRSESLDPSDPSFRPLHGMRDSFRDDGENTFLLKLSYWMGV